MATTSDPRPGTPAGAPPKSNEPKPAADKEAQVSPVRRLADNDVKPGDIVAGPGLVTEPEGLNEDHVATVAATLEGWAGAYGDDVIEEAVKRAAASRQAQADARTKAADEDREAAEHPRNAAPEGRTSPAGKTART